MSTQPFDPPRADPPPVDRKPAVLGTVMLVTPYFPPHLGGVERYTLNLATALLAGGHARRVVVVTTDLGTAVEGPVPGVEGLSIRLLDTGPVISATPLPRRWFSRLSRLIAQEDPDVVNAHAPVPLLSDVAALAARNRPFVLTYHAGRLLKGKPLTDVFLRGYEAVLLRHTAARADAVISSSDFVRRTLGWRLPGRPVVVTPGIAPEWLARPAGGGGDHAIFVGTLKPETRYKGLDDLLAAIALLRERGRPIRLAVVGDGEDRSRYEAKVRELGLAALVRFRGALAGEELIAAYHDAALMVLPTRFDSTPTVLVEAMAAGLPVVSTRVGGVPELVEHGTNGELITPGDVVGLADSISALMADRPRAAAYGQAGRALIESRLTWAHQARLTAEVFERARRRHAERHQPGPLSRPARPTPTSSAAPRRTRVAVVAAYYPPHIGGVESYAEQIVQAAARSDDLEVLVITAAPGRRTTRETRGGVTVVRLATWARLSNTPLSPVWIPAVSRLLRKHDIDVVNAHSPVPGLADVALAVAGRRATIFTYHSGTMVKGHHWSDRVLRRYERHVLPALFRRADAVVAVSKTSLAATEDRARVISPGVDVHRFVPPVAEPPAPELLYVGRIERSSAWKGLDILIRAFALLRPARPATRLTLVGDGDAIDRHRRLAEDLGVADAVRFTGPLSGAELVAAYQGASIVVLPSLTAAESFGISLIEGMACGRPVIGSRIGGIPQVIDDGMTGLLVPPGRPDALATACRQLLDDPELAGRLGRAGRAAAAERWSTERSSSQTLDLIRAVATQPADVSHPARTTQPAAAAQPRDSGHPSVGLTAGRSG